MTKEEMKQAISEARDEHNTRLLKRQLIAIGLGISWVIIDAVFF